MAAPSPLEDVFPSPHAPAAGGVVGGADEGRGLTKSISGASAANGLRQRKLPHRPSAVRGPPRARFSWVGEALNQPAPGGMRFSRIYAPGSSWRSLRPLPTRAGEALREHADGGIMGFHPATGWRRKRAQSPSRPRPCPVPKVRRAAPRRAHGPGHLRPPWQHMLFTMPSCCRSKKKRFPGPCCWPAASAPLPS